MLINKELNIYSFDYTGIITKEKRKQLVQYCGNIHERWLQISPNYKKKGPYDQQAVYNFEIPTKITNTLYNKFMQSCIDLFPNAKFLTLKKKECLVQVSNLKHPSNEWHHHNNEYNYGNSSIIIGVYYLNIPDPHSGQIGFRGQDGKEFLYQPYTDNMVIFPHTLEHRPYACKSDEYRVALNMKMVTYNNIWKELNE